MTVGRQGGGGESTCSTCGGPTLPPFCCAPFFACPRPSAPGALPAQKSNKAFCSSTLPFSPAMQAIHEGSEGFGFA